LPALHALGQAHERLSGHAGELRDPGQLIRGRRLVPHVLHAEGLALFVGIDDALGILISWIPLGVLFLPALGRCVALLFGRLGCLTCGHIGSIVWHAARSSTAGRAVPAAPPTSASWTRGRRAPSAASSCTRIPVPR